jgi:AcrR family transcriptional regulator
MAARSGGGPRRTQDQRRGGRSARVKAAVIASVVDELAEFGYAGVTFERIAARAGVHKATVYRRWPTKEKLVVDALRVQLSHAIPMPNTGSVREDLRVLNHAVVVYITSPQGEGLLRALVSQATLHPEIVAIGRMYWSERFSLVGGVIRRGIERGELPAGTDTDFLLETIIGPLYLRLLVTAQPLTTEFVDRVVDWAIAAACNNAAVQGEARPQASE